MEPEDAYNKNAFAVEKKDEKMLRLNDTSGMDVFKCQIFRQN